VDGFRLEFFPSSTIHNGGVSIHDGEDSIVLLPGSRINHWDVALPKGGLHCIGIEDMLEALPEHVKPTVTRLLALPGT